MSIGLVAVTIACKTFYNERLVYWREASIGSSRLAYFLAKNVADLEGLVLNSLGYASALILVASPSGKFYWKKITNCRSFLRLCSCYFLV
jgi:hypothetical protein